MFRHALCTLALAGLAAASIPTSASAAPNPARSRPYLVHDYATKGAHSVWYNGLDGHRKFVIWIQAGKANGTVSWNGGKHTTKLSSGKLVTGTLLGGAELVVNVSSLGVVVMQIGGRPPLTQPRRAGQRR